MVFLRDVPPPQGNRVFNDGGPITCHSRVGGNPNPRLPSHPVPRTQASTVNFTATSIPAQFVCPEIRRDCPAAEISPLPWSAVRRTIVLKENSLNRLSAMFQMKAKLILMLQNVTGCYISTRGPSNIETGLQGNRVFNDGGPITRHSRAGGNPNPRLPSHQEPGEALPIPSPPSFQPDLCAEK